MSYNIMGKNASFKGDISGTIENQVNDWDNQSIGGTKTFTNTINSSADVMLSGSGKVSASFFYGDGTNLSGVGGTPGGSNREVQFNNSSAFGASANFKFTTANELQVAGQISASLGVSGSEFYGDGSNLTAVTASFVTASNVNGILNASQVNIGEGLETNANAIRVKLDGVNSGLARGSGGMSLDVHGLTNGSYSDTSTIALGVGAGNTTKISLSTLESNLEIDGTQITGGNSISTSVLPINITASGHVSASAFFGDGSALEGVSTAPAGANTQVQFNDAGSAAGNSAFTFSKTTGLMTVTTGSFSKISSSLIPDTTDHFYLGAPDLSVRWANIASVDGNFSDLVVMATGAVNHRLGVGTLSPQNELEVTGTAVVIGNISASVNLSASAFYGSGANLTNTINSIDNYAANRMLVAGGNANNIDAVTQVTFNNPNFAVDGNISASANVEIGANLVIGSQTLSAGELGVLDGVTAGTAAADKAMVLDSNADITGFRRLTSATNSGAFIEVTSSLGKTVMSAEALQIRNSTNTSVFTVAVNDGDVTSAGAIKGASLSASADLQVGGHITGSGDIILSNNNNNKILWDLSGTNDEGPYIHGVSSSSGIGHTKKLEIHGDNDLNLMADSIIRFKVPDGTATVTVDANVLSSSVPVSASALHTNGGITAPGGGGGDFTFLDTNGNVTAGAITMVDDSGVLNFGNNSISGSGNISGSAFYGDGSNLQNVAATPLLRYTYAHGTNANSNDQFVNILGINGVTNVATQHGASFIAPGDGQLEYALITPTTTTFPSSGSTVTFVMLKNQMPTSAVFSRPLDCIVTGAFDIGHTIKDTNNNPSSCHRAKLDFRNGNPNITGSLSFSEGDQLLFGLKTQEGRRVSITVAMTYTGSL